MTAQIGNTANLYAGLKQFGTITNSYAGYLQSGGVAYELRLPFQADSLEWWRYTTYGTAGTVGQGIWFRDFPAGDELAMVAIADNGATGNLNLKLSTSNGITINNNEYAFTDEHLTITGISAGVVTTSTNHGLADLDRVMITKVIGTVAPEVNNKSFVVDVQSATTFKLYDVYGNAIVQSGSYTSSGQVNKEGPRLGVQNSQPIYRLTLGSEVMGADNDVIYFRAFQYNSYYNLGDVA